VPPSRPSVAHWPYFKGAEVFGRDGLSRLIRAFVRWSWRWHPFADELRAVHARVHRAAEGRAPTPEEAEDFLDLLAFHFAESEADKFSLHLAPPERRFQRVDLPCLARIEKLRRDGKGVILATPHFGNLPLMLAALAARLPLSVVLINDVPWKFFEVHGFKVLGLGNAVVPMVSALAANECVVVMSDLEFFPGNRVADLFGAPVRPPQGLCRLSEATGAPILPIYAVTEAGRCVVEDDAPILPEGRLGEELEGPLLRSMERRLGAHPEQWLIFRDIWDLERSDARGRLQRRMISLVNSVSGR
jgi:lauroyl/myristoyl acyltransferase